MSTLSILAPLTSKLPKPQASFLLGESLRMSYKLLLGTELCVRALTSSDSAVKQILLTMNERDNFIVEDLDDFHIIIKADEEYRVRKQLELEVRCCSEQHLPQNGAHISLSWRRIHTAWNDMLIIQQYDKRRGHVINPSSFSHPCIPATSSLSLEGT